MFIFGELYCNTLTGLGFTFALPKVQYPSEKQLLTGKPSYLHINQYIKTRESTVNFFIMDSIWSQLQL